MEDSHLAELAPSKKLEDLTSDLLRRLYLDFRFTETQIADWFGTNQVRIGRLRGKYGIPTLSKSERVSFGLPPFTDVQIQIITGSLLGDGCVTATSRESARFSETHGPAQEAYLRWKAAVLAPYPGKLCPAYRYRRKDGTISEGMRFFTTSCQQFRPFYDLFYPKGVKVFPADLPKRMTPLVLAVWYMDDGDLSSRGEPRITFGLDDTSLSRALQALDRLHLRPKVYGQKIRSIQFPKQAMAFRALVEQHLLPSMTYKMPTETEGQARHRKARVLTPEKAASLYQGGLSVEKIGELYGVGSSTVDRRLKAVGVPRTQTPGPKKNVSMTLSTARAYLGKYTPAKWVSLTPPEQDQWVEDVFQILRGLPIPISPEPSAEDAQRVLAQVREAEMHLDEDNAIMPIRRMGLKLCTPLFPNRYKARWHNTKSAFESWYIDKELRKAIRFQLKYGSPVYPHRVLRAVTMKCRTPSIFRPTVARFIYERYCPKGGKVWDPCAGFGGRLLGALAAGVRYIGTDVEPETIEGNKRLAALLGQSAELILSPAEDFDPPKVDLVFTSPPYFDIERYSEGSDQSWQKYPTMEEWVEGFLWPIVQKGATAGKIALNVKQGPLVDEILRLAERAGLSLVETLRLPLPALNRKNPWEPILVFSGRSS